MLIQAEGGPWLIAEQPAEGIHPQFTLTDPSRLLIATPSLIETGGVDQILGRIQHYAAGEPILVRTPQVESLPLIAGDRFEAEPMAIYASLEDVALAISEPGADITNIHTLLTAYANEIDDFRHYQPSLQERRGGAIAYRAMVLRSRKFVERLGGINYLMIAGVREPELSGTHRLAAYQVERIARTAEQMAADLILPN